MVKICYCQATFSRDFERTKECIERVSSWVDCTIIAYDQSLNDDQIKWFDDNSKKYKLHPVKFVWEDDMPAMRNSYLKKAKELGADWVVVSDPDELFSEQLAKGLRGFIEDFGSKGYNVLGVHAVDQFENVEWLDNLDMLKESPMGYRETDYWKPLLIYRLYGDLRYQGVGKEGRVHETLVRDKGYETKMFNLPKEDYYIHKKSALDIWRNAGRNLFIGGGGNNVGSANIMWLQLRDICNLGEIKGWNDFESFVGIGIEAWLDMKRKVGGGSSGGGSGMTVAVMDGFRSKMRRWLYDALLCGGTAFATETRETAKWYYANHPDEAGEKRDNVLELIKKVQNPNQEAAIINLVTKTYFEVLGRPPDEAGLNNYVNAIIGGWVKGEALADIFRQSDEYKEKFGMSKVVISNKEKEGGGKVHIEVPPIVQQNVTAAGNVGTADTSRHNTVALCIMGYHGKDGKGIDMITESIGVIGREVNEIHIQGDDFTEDDIKRFKDLEKEVGSDGKKINVWNEKWKDDFGDYKNKVIAHANTEWVLIFDHDEIPTQEMAENLKDVIKRSNRGSNYDIVGFDVIDIRLDSKTGDKVYENRNQGGKPLLHWNVPNPYHGTLHIWLKKGYYPWRHARVSAAYRHVKYTDEELERSVRNVVLGGGGDAVKHGNDLWVELNNVRNELGLDTWKKTKEYCEKGNIDNRMLDIFKRLDKKPWKDRELGDPLKWYMKIHPEENERL